MIKIAKYWPYLKTVRLTGDLKGKKVLMVPAGWLLEEADPGDVEYIMLESNEPFILDLSEVSS